MSTFTPSREIALQHQKETRFLAEMAETTSSDNQYLSGKIIGFRAKPEVQREINTFMKKTKRSQSEILRTGLLKEMRSAFKSGALAGLDELQLPVIGSAPCSPFQEVVESAPRQFSISHDISEWLEATPRDAWIIAEGDSMVPYIPEGAMLLLRRIPEGSRIKSGTAVLVQSFDENGNCESTLKFWMKGGERPSDVVLHNGSGEIVPVKDDVVQIVPVAKVQAIISLFPQPQ